MPRRSLLFTPGDRPEMMRKAPGAGADVIAFDLEDAVAPGRKAEARNAVHEVLADPEFDPDCEVCVRLNPTGIAADDDLRAIVSGGDATGGSSREQDRDGVSAIEPGALDSVMLPKTDGAGDAETLARLLREHDYEVPILALVETASGVLNAADIAAVDGVDALLFGAEDLSADIGATRTDEGTEVLYAREHVVLAASAAGVDALDTVFTDIGDTDRLADETEFAMELGYDGKMAIHPAQVEPINGAFTPDERRIEWARRVLAATEEAAAEDRGVFEVDGEMIDAPLIARAEQIVDRARAAGRL